MPSPVEALPCGSRSMMSTRSPIAASAVPRLIAVVVLPTPPFWLARARMRGLCIMASLSMQLLVAQMCCADLDDTAAGIRAAGQNCDLDVPIFSCLGQFGLYILTFQEQGFCTPFYHRGGQFDQNRERGQRPGGYHVDRIPPRRDEFLGAAVANDCRGPGNPRGLAQEGGLLRVALDEMHERTRGVRKRAGEHQAGKAGAGTEINPSAGVRRQRDELQRIGYVSRPQ